MSKTVAWLDIPGFKRYHVSADKQVRSSETEKILVQKKGTGKYYLLNDHDKRVLVTIDELLELSAGNVIDTGKKGVSVKQAMQKKEHKAKVETGQRKDRKGEQKKAAIDLDVRQTLLDNEITLTEAEEQAITTIIQAAESKDAKIYRLHLMGLGRQPIAQLTASSTGNVSRAIWLYKNNKRQLATDIKVGA